MNAATATVRAAEAMRDVKVVLILFLVPFLVSPPLRRLVGDEKRIGRTARMRIRFSYVTIEVDDRLRQRLATSVERLRINVTAYLRLAADDVGAAGQKARLRCDSAADRVDVAMTSVNDKIAPPPAETRPRLVAI
jgi:hypothetical protein